MIIKEVIKELQEMVSKLKETENYKLVIPIVDTKSVDHSSHINVDNITNGFDWDSGLTFLNNNSHNLKIIKYTIQKPTNLKIDDIKQSDLKCCGNCVNRESTDRGGSYAEGCEYYTESSYGWCHKWEYDGLTRKNRKIK